MRTLAWIALPLAAIAALQGQVQKAAPGPAPVPAAAPAQQPATPSPYAADEEAIGKLLDAFVEAFNRADAKTIATLFTEKARIIEDDEEPTIGREAIEKRFAEAFAGNPGSTISIQSNGIAFLDDTTAVEEGSVVITIPTEDASREALSHYTAIYRKYDGKWLQAGINEVSDIAPLTASESLEDLAWMIGEWVDESDDAHVTTTCDWDENHAFLVRAFDVNTPNGLKLSGTQIIGWDPVRKQFRSWVFDSEGGFGEGSWTQIADNAWTIRNEGVSADGEPASSTSIVTYVNDHTIHWTNTDRRIGDEHFPDPVEIVMVKKPPIPGGTEAAANPAPGATPATR